METNKILYGFFVVCLLLGACAEDKGNYNYTLINEVTIDSILSTYSCEAGSRLYIKPDIKSLDETTADLSYSWSIKDTEVSTDKILDITLPPLDYGQQLAALTITDNVTKMQYRRTFLLEIVNPFNWGYYFLTRKDDGSTEMAYIQAVPGDGPVLKDVKYATGCGDYEFGNEPSQLVGSFGSLLGSYYWTITILTQEGNYPAIITDNATFTANSLITEESFSDQSAGYYFKPERNITTIQKEQYFVSEGKFLKYIMDSGTGLGKLYRPANHDREYYWSNPCFAGNGLAFCYVYDELTRKFYVIEPYKTSNPALGIYADANAFDKVVEIADNLEIKGELIYTSVANYATKLNAYSIDADGIHTYSFDKSGDGYSFLGETVLSFANLNEKPAFAVGNGIAANHWYINSGNVIYYSPIEAPQLNIWKELPSDLGLGTIEFIGFSARGSRMVVVLYDENSPEKRKGSVIFINVEDKKITHTFPHILHHCVDYGKFNAYDGAYPFTNNMGDEK